MTFIWPLCIPTNSTYTSSTHTQRPIHILCECTVWHSVISLAAHLKSKSFINLAYSIRVLINFLASFYAFEHCSNLKEQNVLNEISKIFWSKRNGFTYSIKFNMEIWFNLIFQHKFVLQKVNQQHSISIYKVNLHWYIVWILCGCQCSIYEFEYYYDLATFGYYHLLNNWSTFWGNLFHEFVFIRKRSSNCIYPKFNCASFGFIDSIHTFLNNQLPRIWELNFAGWKRQFSYTYISMMIISNEVHRFILYIAKF